MTEHTFYAKTLDFREEKGVNLIIIHTQDNEKLTIKCGNHQRRLLEKALNADDGA